MADRTVEIFRSETFLIDRWNIRIDYPYGPLAYAFTRMGAYQKANRMLRRMDREHEVYQVPKGST